MDYKQLALSSGVVLISMTVAGMIISLLSTLLQCSKVGFGTAALQGLFSSILPTIAYALASYSEAVRRPFSSVFETFGIQSETASFLGIGYLVMITSWVSVVSNINKSEKAVCKPDLKEMTDFKRKLMAELAQKEKEKQINSEKPTGLK